jgi:hypothetical protein
VTARWAQRSRQRLLALAAGVALLATVAAGCGLDVEEPDLFLLTRTGQGTTLTLLVNDSGTIRCNGGKARMISNARLIQARDLADNLGNDAKAGLDLPPKPDSVYAYRIRMQQGTLRFSDRDTLRHPELAQAELFAAQAAQAVCGLSG